MLVRVFGIDLHEVLFIGTLESHLACLSVGVSLYGLEHLCSARDVKYAVNLLQCLICHLTQSTGTLLAIDGGELTIYLLIVVDNPLPNRTLLGV